MIKVINLNVLSTMSLFLVYSSITLGQSEKANYLKTAQFQVIKVGSSLDLTKGLRSVGEGFKRGMNHVIDKANAESNNRWNIDLNIFDDKYTPDIALQNVKKLFTDNHTTILLCPTGTPTLTQCMNFIQEHKMIVLFPSSASLLFRKPDLINIVHLIASDYDAGYALAKYLIKNDQPQKIAIFYQNDAFGRDRLNGAFAAIEEQRFNKNNVIAASYERNDLNFPNSIKQIHESNVDSIIFFSTDISAKSFINQMGFDEIRPKKLYGSSELGSDDFAQFVKRNNLKIALAHEYPNQFDQDLEIAKLFRKDLGKSDEESKLDNYYFGGYIAAQLFVDVLDKIEGQITNNKIISALEAMNNHNFHGMTLTFDKQTRQLVNSVWLETADGIWEEVKTKPNLDQTEPIKAPEKVTTKEQKVGMQKQEDKVIKLGSTLDLSKGLKIEGAKYKSSIQYVVNKQNHSGGIKGKTIKFEFLDDQYIPPKALENVKKLITEDNTDIIIFPTGTATLQAFINLANENKILVLFPGSGASIFHKPDSKNIINLGASYHQEGYVLIKYLIESKGTKKIAFLYQNDEFGRDLLKGAQQAIKDFGLKDDSYISVPYERNDLQFTDGIRRIQDARVDSICFFSTSIATQSFIRQFGIEKIRAKKLCGCSELGGSDFKDFIKDPGLHFIISNLVPNPATGEMLEKGMPSSIIDKFQKDVATSEGELSLGAVSFEAYLGASLLMNILEKIDEPITKEKIIATFETIKNYDFGGIQLNFDKQTRQLLHSIWLDTGKPEWTRIDIPQKLDPKVVTQQAAPKVAPRHIEETEPEGFF